MNLIAELNIYIKLKRKNNKKKKGTNQDWEKISWRQQKPFVDCDWFGRSVRFSLSKVALYIYIYKYTYVYSIY